MKRYDAAWLLKQAIVTVACLLITSVFLSTRISHGQQAGDENKPALSTASKETDLDPAPQSQVQLAQPVVWRNTRLIGSPEPALPYTVAVAFPSIKWDKPLYAKAVPNCGRILVIQQGGEADRPSRILQVRDSEDADQAMPLLDIAQRLAYGLEFHPNFDRNGYLYLFTNGNTGEDERTNRVSRFTLQQDEDGLLNCDVTSESIVLEWRSMGHDGGDLCFGHDGMLYITSGDGTSDSDNWISAQDPSNLLGGVLRIDVDHPAKGMNYSIPVGNPFIDLPSARHELWAIGLRNPWRMSVDQRTGQIWVGNNGQDLWESIHLLGRGENYGWSVYEGSHPFYAHRQLGPGKLTAPTFEHHHHEARSLTGGIVYHGKLWPELEGAYLYGDYATGRIWAAYHDGKQVLWHRLIADTVLQIAGFANSDRGEILIVDHAGEIHRLLHNPVADSQAAVLEFPHKLSETGLFASTVDHQLAPGVIAYDVNATGWNDGAVAERFLALPEAKTIEYSKRRGWSFPDNSVLVQTLRWPVDRSPQAGRKLETRVLLRYQSEWAGYSYVWNATQDDAYLADAAGAEIEFHHQENSSGSGPITWRVPSRTECMTCHSRAVNYVLGISHVQLDRSHALNGQSINQISHWLQLGLFSHPLAALPNEDKPLVNPYDPSQDLLSRVKSYLHTNCSSCHVETGGGNSRMNLEWTTELEKMNVVSYFPQHETFSIAQPRIINPGRPDQSIMLARLSRRGRGQMPPLVSQRVDQQAVELFRQWIATMPDERPFVSNWQVDDFVDDLAALDTAEHPAQEIVEQSIKRTTDLLDSPLTIEAGRRVFREAGCGQCHRIEDEMAGIGPNLNELAQRQKPLDLLMSILNPNQHVEPQYANTILLTDDGLVVQGRVVEETQSTVVLREAESPNLIRRISKSEIEERKLSDRSPMPEGTLNSFQRQEVLDLVAFILAVQRQAQAN